MIISKSVMAGNYIFLCGIIALALVGCKAQEKPIEQKKPAPITVVKPKIPVLSQEQRTELGFLPNMIEQLESATGAKAEPFFATVILQSENLKGETAFESKKLAGFSVRTARADELMDLFRASWRGKKYLIFKSQKGVGSVPDIVTVIKGNNSYDILKIQRTESVRYHHDTKAIIAWLRARQKEGSFRITGAGTDWVEARFTRSPKDMEAFANKVAEFAPDVLVRDTRTMEKLTEWMEQTNGFYLSWD
jgi:hypothetical protein